jgi:hypothetical protein
MMIPEAIGRRRDRRDNAHHIALKLGNDRSRASFPDVVMTLEEE